MKKILALILAAAMLFSLAACSGGAASASGGGNINAYFASSPETIDPTMNSSVDGATYLIHLFQGLFRYKWDGTGVENGDAESYEISGDGMTWTFTLRDDIKWSDGEPVTAQDYEYAWKRVCNPDVAAPYGGDMASFLYNGLAALEGSVSVDEVGVKALDEKTFEVKLSGPCPFFDQVAVFPVFYPVRQDIVEGNDGWWTNPETYVSNGPFKMDSFTLDENMVMVPNTEYYDVSKVVPSSLTMMFLADTTVGMAAVKAGDVDLASGAPSQELVSLKNDGLLNTMDQLGTYYVSFNTEVAPFDNPLVRKALTLAIDRDYIANTVMSGTVVPATGIVPTGFVTDGVDFREAGGDYINLDYEANKALAQEALAEAGYPNGEGFPVIEYTYNTDPTHETIGEVIANSWETVLGIDVNLAVQEWNAFLVTRREGNYQTARNGWIADWMDPSTMLGLFQSTSGNNDGNYNSPTFDQHLADTYATNDQAARMASFHAAEDTLIAEDWAVAPIYFYKINFIVSPTLKDWHYFPLSYTFLHTARIEEAAAE